MLLPVYSNCRGFSNLLQVDFVIIIAIDQSQSGAAIQASRVNRWRTPIDLANMIGE